MGSGNGSAGDSAKNQKKVLKDLRKKVLADLLVQGTNDSSIVSKRSVEMLYSSVEEDAPPFFQHFVKKPQRRSPAINRGYWIRMNSIRKSLDKIVLSENCKTNIIVNLGCGYDPLPFQIIDKKFQFLKNAHKDMDFLCIDIDYPELISLKVEMIKNSPELLDIIGEVDDSHNIEGVLLKTKNYAAVGCNLRDLQLFQRQLTLLGLRGLNTCSVFIAEVSLAYMLPKHADAVINESSTFPKSHFLVLEQLLPTNEDRHPFGRTMLHHFNRLSTPLQCVQTYRTIPSQIERFQKCGFPLVEARDLLGCWDELITESVKEKVRLVEVFDEYEEFVFYTQHYVLVHATNSSKCCFKDENKFYSELPVDRTISCSFEVIENASEFERKFQASIVTPQDDILVVAGSSQNRLNTSLLLSNQQSTSLKMEKSKLPQRMAHTLTPVGDNEYILVGGRNAPHKLLSDCWKLQLQPDGIYKWSPIASLKEQRSRHAAVQLNHMEVLVFGGLVPGCSQSLFEIYNSETDIWRPVIVKGDSIDNMKSALMTFDMGSNTGYLVGGLSTTTKQISNTVYELKYSKNDDFIVVKKIFENDLVQRYGAKTAMLPNKKLLIVGGVSTNYLLDCSTTIVVLDLTTLQLSSIPLARELWHDGMMFVGFDLVTLSNGTLACVGGGAVCFGFGSFWNDKILTFTEGETKSSGETWKISLEELV